MRRVGLAVTAGYLAAVAGIGRSQAVPGASGNLSGMI